MLAVPADGNYYFCLESFLECLKPFFKKGFKQVRTESATFVRDLRPRPSATLYFVIFQRHFATLGARAVNLDQIVQKQLSALQKLIFHF